MDKVTEEVGEIEEDDEQRCIPRPECRMVSRPNWGSEHNIRTGQDVPLGDPPPFPATEEEDGQCSSVWRDVHLHPEGGGWHCDTGMILPFTLELRMFHSVWNIPVRYIPAFLRPRTFHPWSAGTIFREVRLNAQLIHGLVEFCWLWLTIFRVMLG